MLYLEIDFYELLLFSRQSVTIETGYHNLESSFHTIEVLARYGPKQSHIGQASG